MNAEMGDFQVEFERMAVNEAIDRADNSAMADDNGLLFSGILQGL